MYNITKEALGPGESSRPAPERVLEGDPVFTNWSFAQSPVATGIWAGTKGRHLVRRDAHTWEQFLILEGKMILTEDGQAPRTYQAGDVVDLGPNFSGEWHTLADVRKYYVTFQV